MRPEYRTVFIAFLLAIIGAPAHSQIAADESWRLAATVPSPWGTPIGKSFANGTAMRLAPRALEGPSPLVCVEATHEFLRTPAPGLFEGNLPAPAERSARALEMPASIVSQRILCSNGSFDLHRAPDGRLWIGLDNTVLRWERVSVVPSPEATVQALLLQHMAGDMALSRASVAAQSAWLSKTLSEKFNRWFSRTKSSGQVPALNGDPFTDSQEPPESFELTAPLIQGDRAELTVTFGGASIAPYPVHVQLVRVQGTWRIDDLRYRNGQRLSQLLAL